MPKRTAPAMVPGSTIIPHWQRVRKWEHAQDAREHRIEDLNRDLSRMVGLAGLAAREAGRSLLIFGPLVGGLL